MTTGEQVKKFLNALYASVSDSVRGFNLDGTQLSIKVREIGTVDKLINALNVSEIEPMFVDISNMWDKLTITICDYDGSKIDFSTEYTIMDAATYRAIKNGEL